MNRILFFLCLVITTLTFAQNRYTRTADMLFESRRYSWAIKEYKIALEKTPNDYYTLLRLTQANLFMGDVKMARNYLAEAEKNLNRVSLEFYKVKAEVLHQSYKFSDAIEFYKKADPAKSNYRYTSKRINECEIGKKLYKKPRKVKITNLGPGVNSSQHDVLPKITADFLVMYFTSQRKGATGDGKNPEDIYRTTFTGSGWASAARMPEPINSADNEACVGLSQDGQTMFLFRGSNGGDLFISTLKGKKWAKPEPFPYNTEHKESSMCISPDGRTLLFVRTYNGKNAQIYRCRKTSSGNWSKPQLLNKMINSGYDEASPFIHPDGKTLYFSSKGHDSMGGFDIFKSELVNGQWTKPVNMGYPINTPGDDMCFVLSASGQFGFYSSLQAGGLGGQDIYMITMPLPERDKNLAMLKGKVQDAITGKPIEADISIIDNEKGVVVADFKSNAASGEYLIALPAGKNYGIRIEKEGSLFHSENVYLGDDAKFKTLKKNVKLAPSKPGSKMVLKNTFFPSGSFTLDEKSYPELNRVYEVLKANQSLKIEVSGHTDNVGDASANQSLSERRAEEVKKYLVAKGIPSARIKAVGYGSSKPIASNDSSSGRRKNRRTEMKIVE